MSSYDVSKFPSKGSTTNPCFGLEGKWRGRDETENHRASILTDADLARELNSLTVKERQAIEEDIHGVSSEIHETDELVTRAIAEMKDSLRHMPVSTKRSAWDRAVYLRPSLETDQDHFLLFLRAPQFKPFEAAQLLIKYYEAKQEIWGDDLLIHRITFHDLSPKEQEIATSGLYRLFPAPDHRDNAGRGVAFLRFRQWKVAEDTQALNRAVNYLQESVLLDDNATQRKGLVMVLDFRGKMKSTTFQMLRYIASTFNLREAVSFRLVATHALMDNNRLDIHQQHEEEKIRAVVSKNTRVRSRNWYGSTMEIDYHLRTFGIQVQDCLDPSSPTDAMSYQSMTTSIRERQDIEDQCRQSQAPYTNPESPIALFPNKHDILMGNRMVATTWPGNVQFKRVISEEAVHYMVLTHRTAKTAFAKNVIMLMRTKYQSRFLTRTDTQWETMDPAEVLRKVSQAFRDEARKSMTPVPIR